MKKMDAIARIHLFIGQMLRYQPETASFSDQQHSSGLMDWRSLGG